jgi:hypothetical protein
MNLGFRRAQLGMLRHNGLRQPPPAEGHVREQVAVGIVAE